MNHWHLRNTCIYEELVSMNHWHLWNTCIYEELVSMEHLYQWSTGIYEATGIYEESVSMKRWWIAEIISMKSWYPWSICINEALVSMEHWYLWSRTHFVTYDVSEMSEQGISLGSAARSLWRSFCHEMMSGCMARPICVLLHDCHKLTLDLT